MGSMFGDDRAVIFINRKMLGYSAYKNWRDRTDCPHILAIKYDDPDLQDRSPSQISIEISTYPAFT